MKQPKAPTGRAKMAFILGHPVAHSLSPAMHNAAFACLRLPYCYAPLDVPPEAVGDVVGALRSGNVLGANVTVPHKEAVIRHLDEVEREALQVRSVNTIYKRGNRLIGTSTDGEGFLRSLDKGARSLHGSSALLIGAGGASRSVAGALRRVGVHRLYVLDLSPERVKDLVGFFKKGGGRHVAEGVDRREAERRLCEVDLVVQATPMGLHSGDPSPLSLRAARRGTLAVDLIYHRPTAFLLEARRRGLKALDGSGMLIHQGALSFSYWTGKRAPLSVMAKAFKAGLKG